MAKHRVRIQSLLSERNCLPKISLISQLAEPRSFHIHGLPMLFRFPWPPVKICASIFCFVVTGFSDSKAAGNEIYVRSAAYKLAAPSSEVDTAGELLAT
jgi:hypothetical protein